MSVSDLINFMSWSASVIYPFQNEDGQKYIAIGSTDNSGLSQRLTNEGIPHQIAEVNGLIKIFIKSSDEHSFQVFRNAMNDAYSNGTISIAQLDESSTTNHLRAAESLNLEQPIARNGAPTDISTEVTPAISDPVREFLDSNGTTISRTDNGTTIVSFSTADPALAGKLSESFGVGYNKDIGGDYNFSISVPTDQQQAASGMYGLSRANPEAVSSLYSHLSEKHPDAGFEPTKRGGMNVHSQKPRAAEGGFIGSSTNLPRTSVNSPYTSNAPTTFKGAAAFQGTNATTAAIGAYGLYEKLKDGGSLEADITAGGNQANLAAGLGIDIAATTSGTVATINDALQAAGKTGLSSGATSALGKANIAFAVTSGSIEYAVAKEAVDGNRAARAAGSTLGGIAFGAGSSMLASSQTANPYIIGTAGIVGGVTGAFTVGPLAETAFGEKLQTDFEIERQTEVDNTLKIATETFQTPAPDATRAKTKIENLRTELNTAYQNIGIALERYGKSKSPADEIAVSIAQKQLAETVDNVRIAALEVGNSAKSESFKYTAASAIANGMAELESGRKVFSTAEVELQRQVNEGELAQLARANAGQANAISSPAYKLAEMFQEGSKVLKAANEAVEKAKKPAAEEKKEEIDNTKPASISNTNLTNIERAKEAAKQYGLEGKMIDGQPANHESKAALVANAKPINTEKSAQI